MVTLVRRQGKERRGPRLNVEKEMNMVAKEGQVRGSRKTAQSMGSMVAKGRKSMKTRDRQARGTGF